MRREGRNSPPNRAYAGQPRRPSQSLRLTDVATTRTSTCPARGDGTATSLDAQHLGRAVAVADDGPHANAAVRSEAHGHSVCLASAEVSRSRALTGERPIA